jgi:hypothetical protein
MHRLVVLVLDPVSGGLRGILYGHPNTKTYTTGIRKPHKRHMHKKAYVHNCIFYLCARQRAGRAGHSKKLFTSGARSIWGSLTCSGRPRGA